MNTSTPHNWFYENFDKQLLYMMFNEEKEFCEALAYLLTFKKYKNLKVTPHTFSIEIACETLHIFLIHTVFFEQKEYEKVKHLPNVYYVVLRAEIAEMVEFSAIKSHMKYISKAMLVATVEALTKNEFSVTLQRFKALTI